MSLIYNNESIFWISALVFGAVFGSFLNVVIYRLSVMLGLSKPANDTVSDIQENNRFSIAFPRSYCPLCGHKITAFENIPIFSYLFLRGQCSDCKQKISITYPVVETATMLITVGAFWRFGATWQFAAAVPFLYALICIFVLDFKYQIIPDALTIPFIGLGIIVNYFNVFVPFQDALWGAGVGYMSLWSLYWGVKLIFKIESMGYGDFKLFAVLGAWLGWQKLFMLLLLASGLGAVIGISLMFLGSRQRGTSIAFGPFLIAACFIVFPFGDELLAYYWAVMMPS
ncbi:MAG: prepilin peptidase [Rhodospirillaceae bacterium]|nr:MAG: prepilin peptidase [Rhodospirillaceae bacterium]